MRGIRFCIPTHRDRRGGVHTELARVGYVLTRVGYVLARVGYVQVLYSNRASPSTGLT